MRCLARDPGRRYRTAAALLADLESCGRRVRSARTIVSSEKTARQRTCFFIGRRIASVVLPP
jgi:hypothetical protein